MLFWMKKISTIKPFYFKVPLGTTVVTIIGPAAAEKTKNVVTTEASARRCGFESHHCHHKMNNRIFFSKIKKNLHPFPIYSRQKSLKEITWGQIISTKTEFQLANGCIKEYMARNILFSPLGHVAFDSLVGRTVSFWRKGWRIAPTACDFFSIQLLPLFP